MNRLTIIFICAFFASCKNSYLDVVPDNVSTLDHAFSNELTAERFLFTCYSYLPDLGDPQGNIGFLGSDEMWTIYPGNTASNYFPALFIAMGAQNINDPYMNFWDGSNGGKPLFMAIRDCNIFLDNVSDPGKVSGLSASLRSRWIAEVTFLKAYYHFYLLRMYGPIPVIDKNLPISASISEVRKKRMPVDSVVNYIVSLIDDAVPNLPKSIIDKSTELGRITQSIALSIKARLLVTVASPLFNGNSAYRDFKDKDGVPLFNTAFDPQKWEAAVQACEAAVQSCEQNGMYLYEFNEVANISDTTRLQLSIRNSVAERINPETIWPMTGSPANSLQNASMARIDSRYNSNIAAARDYFNPTIGMAENFYTNHGIPIDEDKFWHYSDRYDVQPAHYEDRFNLIEGYEVAAMHFDREPRFYASMGFDGSIWYMQNSPSGSDENTWNIRARDGGNQAAVGPFSYSITGYWAKKLVNWKFVIGNGSYSSVPYAWPAMRLADLYLLYAEALNEVGRREDAIVYIDKVRKRAGLEGVKESWDQYAVVASKYTTIEGLRDIIRQERTVELAFEGHRYWDIRRWKLAEELLNQSIQGWTLSSSDAVGYYQPRTIFSQRFVFPRDYFAPLREQNLIENPNLVQNPGW